MKNIFKISVVIFLSLLTVGILTAGFANAETQTSEGGRAVGTKIQLEKLTEGSSTPEVSTVDRPMLKLDFNLGYSAPKVNPGGHIGYSITQDANSVYKAAEGGITYFINGVGVASGTNLYAYRIYQSRRLTDAETVMDITHAESSLGTGSSKLIASGMLKPGENKTASFSLSSSTVSGDYHAKIVIDDLMAPLQESQYFIARYTVAKTNGVILEVPDKIVQGTKPSIKIKFYGLAGGGNKYAIYVDEEQKDVLEQDKLITKDEQIVYYEWDTSGTGLGDHTVMVKVFPGTTANNNKTEKTTKVVAEEEVSFDNGTGSSSGSNPSNWSKFVEKLSKTLKDFLGFTPGDQAGANASLSSVNHLIKQIIQYALDAAGVVAFIMILYASIIYLTAYGEESKAELAKKTLVWSVIGLIVIIFSQTIILIIYNYILK